MSFSKIGNSFKKHFPRHGLVHARNANLGLATKLTKNDNGRKCKVQATIYSFKVFKIILF